jgi:hypothetical protein
VIGATNGRFINLAVMLTDNKVLVAGNGNATTRYYIEKHLEDGSGDPNFEPNGCASINLVPHSKDHANAIKVLQDGNILIAGTTDSDLCSFTYY